MTIKRIIPDAYTEYEDGHLGVIPASLANVEAKIGAADSGQPNKVYTLAGPDAKKHAKTIFQGGPLLNAIEAAFDAGSSRIHAVCIGSGTRAQIILPGIDESDTLRIRGAFGESGNKHFVNVTQIFEQIIPAYALVFANPNRVLFYDEDMEIAREVLLPAEIASVVGVTMPLFPVGPYTKTGFSILGYAASDNHPMIWRFDTDDVIIASQTVDISSYLNVDESISGLVQMADGPNDGLSFTTDKRLYSVDMEDIPIVNKVFDYTTLGMTNPDISSACFFVDLPAQLNGEESDAKVMFLDPANGKIIGFVDQHDSLPVLLGEVDLSAWLGVDDTPEAIITDVETGNVKIAVYNMSGDGRLLSMEIDWQATPNPIATLLDDLSIPADVAGAAYAIADADVRTTITIQDRNLSPLLDTVFEATGSFSTVTANIAAQINNSGIYQAELIADPARWLMPSLTNGDEGPDPTWFDPFTGGADTAELSNADYLAGLEATKAKTDTAWIHAVGATSQALWTAILLHCDEMEKDQQAERFAILETPEFTSEYDEGSAGYLADLQTYVDNIVSQMAMVGDRNACVLAGSAMFLDSDGNENKLPITAACGGCMAGLEVQKSLINKPVRGVLKLVPEFPPGHIQSLIQARVNCLRFKPGRGFIIAHSLTAAAVGSDYSRVNDLRAVYYGSKAAREASQLYVGEENDSAGEGLRRLESAMSRPLEQMRDAGQIDAFELTAVSSEQNRVLGDVYVSLGIKPLRAMEMIYTTVYLQ